MKLDTDSITIVLTVAILAAIPAVMRSCIQKKARDARTIKAALRQKYYRVSWVMIGFCVLQFVISACFLAITLILPNPEIGSICFFVGLSLAAAFLGTLSLRRFSRMSVIIDNDMVSYKSGRGASIVDLKAIKRVYTSAWLIVMELEDGRKATIPMLFAGSHRLLARLQHARSWGRSGEIGDT